MHTNVNKGKVYKHQHLKCNCSGGNIFSPEGRQVALFMNSGCAGRKLAKLQNKSNGKRNKKSGSRDSFLMVFTATWHDE